MMPQFSICIPTYNRGKELKYTILSVLNQTFENWVLFIMDDSTNNDTELLIKELNNKKITYVKNDSRLGLVKNWNKCLEVANNEYIQILHHDDLLMPNAIELYTKFILKHKNIMFLHGNSFATNAPYFKKLNSCITQEKEILLNGDEAVSKVLLNHNFTCSTVVINRKVIEKLGYFDINAWVSPDFEYFARIGKHFDFYHVDKPIAVVVSHSQNTHVSGYTFESFYNDNKYYQDKVFSYLSENKHEIQQRFCQVLRSAFFVTGLNLFFSKKYIESYKFIKFSNYSVLTFVKNVIRRIIRNSVFYLIYKKKDYKYLYSIINKNVQG